MPLTKVRYLPDFDRLSVLAASIMLAYTVTRFVSLPGQQIAIQLPFFYAVLQLNAQTLITWLAAGLTATGSHWLIRDHPLAHRQAIWRHTLLPSLTALVISTTLSQVEFSPLWWLTLLIGCVWLTLVVIAEYISVDSEDSRYPLAAAWLTGVSYVLYLVMAVSLRTLGARLFFILPTLTAAGWLVSLRALHLRLNGEWTILEATLIALLVGQVAAPLHYWPLSPLTFGVVVLGLTYTLTSFVGGIAEGKELRQALFEPGVIVCITLAAAVWLR